MGITASRDLGGPVPTVGVRGPSNSSGGAGVGPVNRPLSPETNRLASQVRPNGGGAAEVAPFRTPPQSPPTIHHAYAYDTSGNRGFPASPTSTSNAASDASSLSSQRTQAARRATGLGAGNSTAGRVPTVVTWHHGGREVVVEGSWDNWKSPIPLTRSTGNFTTILELPPGTYHFRFRVDGRLAVDDSSSRSQSSDGQPVNTLVVLEQGQSMMEEDMMDSFLKETPPGSYGREIPVYSESLWNAAGETESEASGTSDGLYSYDLKTPVAQGTSDPPSMPHHLLRPLLNSRQSDPSVLPIPHYVTLQHVTVQHSEPGMVVLGTSQRFRKKFYTTVYIQASDRA